MQLGAMNYDDVYGYFCLLMRNPACYFSISTNANKPNNFKKLNHKSLELWGTERSIGVCKHIVNWRHGRTPPTTTRSLTAREECN